MSDGGGAKNKTSIICSMVLREKGRKVVEKWKGETRWKGRKISIKTKRKIAVFRRINTEIGGK